MKAVYIAAEGDVQSLLIGERPDPVPAPRDVLVRVRATALNRIDVWTRQGVFQDVSRLEPQEFPRIPGVDVAGVVAGLGDGVSEFTVGDEVLANPAVTCDRCADCQSGHHGNCRWRRSLGVQLDGGYAELVAVPAVNLHHVPSGVDLTDAAAIPTAFMTAWQVVMTRARVQPGDRVLVHAAGSGVGSAAIQVARLAGARVFATAGTDDKIQQAKALGAEAGANYQREDFASAVLEWTSGVGADVIVDPVGGAVWTGNLACIRRGGTIVPCGFTGGYRVELDLREVLKHRIAVIGSGSLGAKNDMRAILDEFAAGTLRPVVGATYPLAEVAAATRLLESRQVFGKVLLIP